MNFNYYLHLQIDREAKKIIEEFNNFSRSWKGNENKVNSRRHLMIALDDPDIIDSTWHDPVNEK